MQALQHQAGEGPLSANKEVEIRSLKSEIDILKKQIAGQNMFLFTFSEALVLGTRDKNLIFSNKHQTKGADCLLTPQQH